MQVVWQDEVTARLRFDEAEEASFDYYPKWIASSMEQLAESDGAVLLLDGENPNLYDGVDPAKLAASRRAAAAARQTYLGYVRSNKLVHRQCANPGLGGCGVSRIGGRKPGTGLVGSDIFDEPN